MTTTYTPNLSSSPVKTLYPLNKNNLHPRPLFFSLSLWTENSFKLQCDFRAFFLAWRGGRMGKLWRSSFHLVDFSQCCFSTPLFSSNSVSVMKGSSFERFKLAEELQPPERTKGGHWVWVSVTSSGMARIFWPQSCEEVGTRRAKRLIWCLKP